MGTHLNQMHAGRFCCSESCQNKTAVAKDINSESLNACNRCPYPTLKKKKNRCNFSWLTCPIFLVFLCFVPALFLFPLSKKIDEENEANLLAVLTETLDSIPVDEDGLPSFEALADGDVTNASDRSCPSSPDASPHTPEPEEPSLVKQSWTCLHSEVQFFFQLY